MEKKPTSYRTLFADIAKSKNYKVSKPTYLQRKDNIDLVLEGQSDGVPQEVTVDIKKKNGKNSNQWVYIEYKNSKGGEGWLYGGAQFVVFETSSSFIFVPRKALINYLNNRNINFDYILSKYFFFYILYTLVQHYLINIMNIYYYK